MTDSDAVYPKYYIPAVKYFIRKYNYPIMGTVRKGGLNNIITRVYEHGLIVRKDVFLYRCKNFNGYGRDDISPLFQDAKKIPVKYYHDWTTLEKKALNTFKNVASFITTTYALYNIARKVVK